MLAQGLSWEAAPPPSPAGQDGTLRFTRVDVSTGPEPMGPPGRQYTAEVEGTLAWRCGQAPPPDEY